MMADQILAVGRELLGPQATTLVVSPWGLAPSWLAVNAGKVLATPVSPAPSSPKTVYPVR